MYIYTYTYVKYISIYIYIHQICIYVKYRVFLLVVRCSFVLPTEPVIGLSKSRDLFKPITVVACKTNEHRTKIRNALYLYIYSRNTRLRRDFSHPPGDRGLWRPFGAAFGGGKSRKKKLGRLWRPIVL